MENPASIPFRSASRANILHFALPLPPYPTLLALEDEARDTLESVIEKAEIYEQDTDWRCEE